MLKKATFAGEVSLSDSDKFYPNCRRLGFFYAPTDHPSRVYSNTHSPMRLTLLIWLFLLPSLLWAQSSVKIRGTVVDAQTGEALPDANVQILNTAMGTATDARGRFEFEHLLNGHYRVRASYMGYETVEHHVRVADGPPAELYLRLPPVVLSFANIQISAERPEDPAANSSIILTQEDIQRSQVANIGELLKRVGGVQILDSGGAGGEKTISIRGGRANQILVLLDGVPLNDQLTGKVDLSAIPVAAIERVEIQKGSASAEYGSGALGGVVTIHTRHRSEEAVRLAARLGPFGFLQVEPAIAAQWRQLHVMVTFQAIHSDSDFPYVFRRSNDALSTEERYNADLLSQNFVVRAAWQSESHNASVGLQTLRAERGHPGRVHYLTPFARSVSARDILTADYRYTAQTWQLQLNGNTAAHRSESFNLKPENPDMPFGSTPQFHMQNNVRSKRLDVRVQHQPFDVWQQTVGFEWSQLNFADQNRLAPAHTPIGQASDVALAGFWRSELNINPSFVQFKVAPLLRYDVAYLQNESRQRKQFTWSPNLNVFAALGRRSNVYIRGNVGRGFRMPTYADLFYQDFRVQGKPDLLPEQSVNRELTFGARLHSPVRLHASATAFRNDVQDMIVWRLGSFEFFRPYNTDVELSGEEYSLTLETRQRRFSWDMFYTTLRARNKNENVTLYDKLIPYRPMSTLKSVLSVEFPQWQASLQYRQVGKRFITEANTKSMPPYQVVDLTVSVLTTVKPIDVRWQFAVFNLLNEPYEILRDMPLPGREWRLGLQVSY